LYLYCLYFSVANEGICVRFGAQIDIEHLLFTIDGRKNLTNTVNTVNTNTDIGDTSGTLLVV